MPIVIKTEEERNPTKPVEENLTQIAYSEGEEEKLALQFIEENGLYSKFLLWQGVMEQLRKLREDLAS